MFENPAGRALERLGLAFEGWVRRNMPDPFVLVLALTLLTLALSFLVHPTVEQLVTTLPRAWFKGFWDLLAFSMQMVLIVVTGEAIVETRPIQKALKWAAAIPTSATGMLLLLSYVALAAGWLHWGFGLIGAALFARELARRAEQLKIKVDYPLLGAAAYLSMLLWHAGTTATAPLLINTPGHFLEKQIGLVPLSETIFLPMNTWACLILFLVCPWIIAGMNPKKTRAPKEYIDLAQAEQPRSNAHTRTLAERLDENPWMGRITGTTAMFALITVQILSGQGWNLTHNVVNFFLLALGLTLHGSPTAYSRAISKSVRGTSGIVLQYPFYGGIMGLMEGSGLGHVLSSLFLNWATAATLPFFAYLAATFTKLFVPSGGGEWAIEGPLMLQAARELGAPVGKTTMAIAYGNMVGNLFQPFWAIPLLSVLGLKARDIMGYCLVVFLFAFPVLGLALLLG